MVSVIIPLYNAEIWIERTINSCLDQREFIKEILVIDNGSSDQGPAIVKNLALKHGDLIHYFSIEERGANVARNFGFNKAAGKYIQWLDADDQLLSGKLKAQICSFEENPQTDIVYSDWQLDIYGPGFQLIRSEYKNYNSTNDFLKDLLEDRWLPPHAYLLRYDIAKRLSEAGLWNPTTRVLQDREYFTMAAVLKAKFSYCKINSVVYNRWNHQSISQGAGEKDRALSLNALMYLVKKIINEDSAFEDKKRIYNRIINSNIVMASRTLNAMDKEPSSFTNIEWKHIKGYSTRLKCFFFYLKWIFKTR